MFILSFTFVSKKQWIIETDQSEFELLESESNQTAITKNVNNFDTENAEEYEIE